MLIYIYTYIYLPVYIYIHTYIYVYIYIYIYSTHHKRAGSLRDRIPGLEVFGTQGLPSSDGAARNGRAQSPFRVFFWVLGFRVFWVLGYFRVFLVLGFRVFWVLGYFRPGLGFRATSLNPYTLNPAKQERGLRAVCGLGVWHRGRSCKEYPGQVSHISIS